MANVQHSALTGAELHEPKGASGASADTVYSSDGAGSGSWVKVDAANIDTTSIFNINTFQISRTIADVSTAETIYIPTPHAITVEKAVSVMDGAITGSDATITLKNSAGTPMTGGAMTIAVSGSGSGITDTVTPTGNNTISADSFFTIETDGASTGTVKLIIIVECLRTA
jgi:hypothetical protein